MRILISGSHGFLGSALMAHLTAAGHRLTRLVRPHASKGAGGVPWDPAAGTIDVAELEGIDAVVHLAGESVIGRWTPEKKARIRDSRVNGTRLLAESLGRMSSPPHTFVCASAIGYYGDRGDDMMQEDSPAGAGFLAEVCQAWEAAAQPAARAGIRVVNLRTGLVLSPRGGALAKMLPPFRLGLGGRLGSGRQYMSWIAIDDWLQAVGHILQTPALRGPVNLVAPNPVTNAEFTKTLGRVLGRPTVLPVPAFAIRIGFGEMGQALFLASARVTPAALAASGFVFRYPHLEAALRHLVG